MREFVGDSKQYESSVADDGSVLVLIDCTVDEDLIQKVFLLLFNNRILQENLLIEYKK